MLRRSFVLGFFLLILFAPQAMAAGAVRIAHPIAKPGTMADRYGVIITGVPGDPGGAVVLDTVIGSTGARWWYQYDQTVPDSPSANIIQVRMLRYRAVAGAAPDLAANLALIHHQPQTLYWLIGNEPNDPGQDEVDPATYAEWAHTLLTEIHRVNPGARTIGPNTLNWDVSCQGCPGFQTGRDWTAQMRAVYRAHWGTEPPFTIWSVHTYDLNWTSLPTTNWTFCEGQILDFRSDLDAVAALHGKPIWLTEFGVVWGYPGIRWDPAPGGGWHATALGNYQESAIAQYLAHMLSWLEQNSTRLRIRKWFVYTTYGLPEPYTDTFTGLSLFDRAPHPGAQLTGFGWQYRGAIQHAVHEMT